MAYPKKYRQPILPDTRRRWGGVTGPLPRPANDNDRFPVIRPKPLPKPANDNFVKLRPKSFKAIFPKLRNPASIMIGQLQQNLSVQYWQTGGGFSGVPGWFKTNGDFSPLDYPVTVTIGGVPTVIYPYSGQVQWSPNYWEAGPIAGQALSTYGDEFAPGGSANNITAGQFMQSTLVDRWALAQAWKRNLSQPEGVPYYSAQVASLSSFSTATNWLVNVLPHAFPVGSLFASPYAPPMWMSPHRVNHPAIDPVIGYQAGYGTNSDFVPYTKAAQDYAPYRDISFGLNTNVAPVIAANPHVNVSPSSRVRERKTKSRFAGVAWAFISGVTESLDALDAFHDALPKSVRQPRPPRHLWGDAQATAAWRRAQNTPQARAERLWRNWASVDLDIGVRNLVKNQINDWFWGKVGIKGGPHNGPGWEFRLNGGNVQQFNLNGTQFEIRQSPIDPGEFILTQIDRG